MSGPPSGGPGQRPTPNGVNGNMAISAPARSDGIGGNGPGNPPGSMSQQNLNQIVIEYLSKKGYSRTEAMLRTESAQHEPDGRPRIQRTEDEGGRMYHTATDLLTTWIDGVLDIYKPELRRLPWPVFVHSFLALVEGFYQQYAKEYFNTYRERFEDEHKDDLRKLEPLLLPEHLETSEIAKMYLKNKYRVTMSNSGYYQLVQFLESKSTEGGSVLMGIIHTRLRVVAVERASEDRVSLANMLSRSKLQENFPAEDEGIPGHNPGSAILDQEPGSTTLTRLQLGPLEMEPDLLGDVMAELDEEDAKNPPPEGKNTLRQEFDQMIKTEPDLDGPDRTTIPLPPSKARDVLMEVQKVKENRDRFKIEGKTGGAAPGISVCMFTFHNSYDSITCVQISDDNKLIAIGLDQHYIRVWNVDGKPLPSDMEGEQPQASRRLIGHSGPVYNISFSPAINNPDAKPDDDPSKVPTTDTKWLLSCSADKSVRLWHLGAWQCLVVYKAHMGPVWDVTWGPFGHYFLTGSHDKTARLWSTEQISPLRMFVGHDDGVDVVAFHPNNAYCFTGSSDHHVRMWLLSTGAQVRLFTGHTGNITSLACSPSGRILASADTNGHIILWDILPGRLQKRMRGHGKGGIWSLSWSVESTVLISGGMDGTVRVWDATKPADAPGQGKIMGDGGAGAKIDVGTQGQAGGKKKGKENVVSNDQISAFPTKKSPVYKVKFTRMNLALAAGAYMP